MKAKVTKKSKGGEISKKVKEKDHSTIVSSLVLFLA